MSNGDHATKGSWSSINKTPGFAGSLTENSGAGFGIFSVHAALLHTGDVLMWSGRAEGAGFLYLSATWHYQSGATAVQQFVNFKDPAEGDGTGWVPGADGDFPAGYDIDLFCAHQTFLGDGRLLVVGGASGVPDESFRVDGDGNPVPSEDYQGSARGVNGIYVFDPDPDDGGPSRWERLGAMAHGRWYPTAVLLQDGRVVVVSGRPRNPTAVAVGEHEILTPPGYSARAVTGPEADAELPIYPDFHMVPGGKLFYTGCAWGYGIDPRPTAYFRMLGATDGEFQEFPDAAPAQANREEGTSVLLPPAQAGRILVIGGGRWQGPRDTGMHAAGTDTRSWEILATQGAAPEWVASGQLRKPRVNVSAVLLPDGKVLIVGGHNRHKFSHETSGHSLTAEIFDPETALGGAATPTVETGEMNRARMYHSVALLLPNGKVWVAGGDDYHASPTTPGEPVPGDQKSYEIYSPPYLFKGQQPTIEEVIFEDGPAGELSYGGRLQLRFTVESGAAIEKVVLMRPGATTHHTDTDQRYIALPTFNVDGDRITATVVSDPTVAPPGYYMVWIVDDQGRPCVDAPFVKLGFRGCDLVTDRSSFSRAQVDAARDGSGEYTFDQSFYLHVAGHTGAELGLPSLDPAELSRHPSIKFTRRSDGSTVPATVVEAVPERLVAEDPSLPLGARQRLVFAYGLRFKQLEGASIFSELTGDPSPPIFLDMEVEIGDYTCHGDIKVFDAPNPFMIDGPVPWLSNDVRVFRLHPGEERLGQTLSEGDPHGFIQSAIDNLNNGSANFEDLTEDQRASELSLVRSDSGGRVFNFAVSRVRYRGDVDAANVRVFFRMFRWQSTSLEFTDTAYPAHQDGDRVVPLLGFDSDIGEIVSIPFFAKSREANMADQSDDPHNVRTLSGTGALETAFFGCWLDFNQNDAHFPERPVGTGPFADRVPINTLIRGHQCLVAEIRYDLDATDAGDTPADSDNLAQRNLAIDMSDNPSPDAHTVQTTFDLKISEDVDTPILFLLDEYPDNGARPFDELMLVLLDLPREATLELFVPELDVDEILALASLRGGPVTLEKIDADTLRCRAGTVAYVPLTAEAGQHVAGLLTVHLPEGIEVAQTYRVTAHQITRRHNRVEGSFELFIPVVPTSDLTEREVRRLSFFRYVLESMAPEDRWRVIWLRQLEQLADKVRALGIDPDLIQPSADGDAMQWPMFRGNPARTGRSPYRGPRTPDRVIKVDLGGDVRSSPALALDGTIYVGSDNNRFYAIDPDGTIKWEFDTRGDVSSSPAVGIDGTVYFGSNDNRVYALDPDGNLRRGWPLDVGRDVGSSPVIGPAGTIYLGSEANCLHAIDPATGRELWATQVDGDVESSPAIAPDGTLYFGDDEGKLNAVEPANGRLLWTRDLRKNVRSSPAIANDTVYVGSDDHQLYAFGLDGTFKWCFPTDGPIRSSPAIGLDGTIYFGSRDNHVYAIEEEGTRGRLKWRFKTGRDVRSSPLIAADGVIYVGSDDDQLYALMADGPDSSRLLWSLDLGGNVRSSPCLARDGALCIGSSDDKLYIIRE